MKKPNGGNRILKKYCNNELIKLKSFFDNDKILRFFIEPILDGRDVILLLYKFNSVRL